MLNTSPKLGCINCLCMFSSFSFLKLHWIRFSVRRMYVCPWRNINSNSHSLFESDNVLFLKFICIEKYLNTSSTIRNGKLIGTTFVQNSRNILFSKVCRVLNVPRLFRTSVSKLTLCADVRRFGALCRYFQQASSWVFSYQTSGCPCMYTIAGKVLHVNDKCACCWTFYVCAQYMF